MLINKLSEEVNEFKIIEEKNREAANKWLDEVAKIISPIAGDIWGYGISPEIKDIYNYDGDIFRLIYCPNDDGFFMFAYKRNIQNYGGDLFWNAYRAVVCWASNNLPQILKERAEKRKEIIDIGSKLMLGVEDDSSVSNIEETEEVERSI